MLTSDHLNVIHELIETPQNNSRPGKYTQVSPYKSIEIIIGQKANILYVRQHHKKSAQLPQELNTNAQEYTEIQQHNGNLSSQQHNITWKHTEVDPYQTFMLMTHWKWTAQQWG